MSDEKPVDRVAEGYREKQKNDYLMELPMNIIRFCESHSCVVLVVLVSDKYDVGTAFVVTYKHDGSHGWCCENESISSEYITHWMPLPELPEEEDV
ncbi:MAG: DUF551 domain-containing protein [Eubacteriales bacterium]|nr:DUF551 domain-containing protein [Eubacteriales bacterium]